MKLNNKMMISGSRNSNSFVVDVDVVSMTMILLLSSYLSSLPGVMANVNITFACWSTAVNETCDFRTFSEIGGELVMMDTGSSDLAFCKPPAQVSDKQRATAPSTTGGEILLSQCQIYGNPPSHGWYGNTYVANLTTGGEAEDSITPNSYFSVIEETVGGNSNFCGPVASGTSIGFKENSTINGIWGIGGLNQYVETQEIDSSSWTDVQSCGVDTCTCPDTFIKAQSNFVETITKGGIKQWALSWDGKLGKDTGKLLLGDDASIGVPEDTPKMFLSKSDITAQDGGWGLYRTNVTGIELNGTEYAMNNTEYAFDTGTPFISLPQDIYDTIYSSGEETTIVFTVLTVDGGKEDAKIEMTITKELLDDGVFLPASDDALHFIGLPIMRYLETMLLNFDGDDAGETFLQVVPREEFILNKISDLDVTELAGISSTASVDKEFNTNNSNLTDDNIKGEIELVNDAPGSAGAAAAMTTQSLFLFITKISSVVVSILAII